MNRHDFSKIILFLKAPIQGHVKTRLTSCLNESTVLEIYKRFVTDILKKATRNSQNITIFYDPAGSKQLMIDWLGNHFDYYTQTGADLGQRMDNAFRRMFQSGINRAVLIGTDFPDLPENFISDALTALNTHEAVIGPTIDGGYYLIGFREDSFPPDIFQNIPWGTDTVYEETMKGFERVGVSVQKLPRWRDIDTYDDLLDLVQSISGRPHEAPETFAFLRDIGILRDQQALK